MIDNIPRESVVSWTNHLRSIIPHPVILFRSASAFLPSASDTAAIMSKGKSKPSTNDAMGMEGVRGILEKWASERTDSEMNVAIVGLTNVSFLPLLFVVCSDKCLCRPERVHS